MSKQSYLKLTLLVLFVLTIASLLIFFDIGRLFRPEALRGAVDSLGSWGPLVFIALYVLATVFFLPGSPLSIAAGLLFGAVFGTLYILIGATIGATLAFLFSRYLGKNFVDGFLKDKSKKVLAYNQSLLAHGFLVVLFLRLVPLFPFNGLNFALGLTKVKLKDYVLATLIGIAPGAFVFAYLGDSLSSPQLFQIILAVGLLALLIAAPVLYKKYRQRQGKSIVPTFSKSKQKVK